MVGLRFFSNAIWQQLWHLSPGLGVLSAIGKHQLVPYEFLNSYASIEMSAWLQNKVEKVIRIPCFFSPVGTANPTFDWSIQLI